MDRKLTVAERLPEIREHMRQACLKAHRDPQGVTLIAVSKGQTAESIRQAYDAGQRDFGENYAQEFVSKQQQLKSLSDIRWHFIGSLQRNKVKLVLPLVTMIHSIDSVRLAEEVGKQAQRLERTLRVLIQVNTGDEPQKGGCSLQEALRLAQHISPLSGLNLCGMMTVPPAADAAEESRVYFRTLRELCGQLNLEHLSMGMSHDYEVAIEEGSTFVRIGTSLFGPRTP